MCDTDLLLYLALSLSFFSTHFLFFSCASCFIRLVIYRLFSNFPSRSFQFSFDSCFIEINTRIYYIHDVWPFVCVLAFEPNAVFLIFFFLSCCRLAFVLFLAHSVLFFLFLRSFTDSPNYFSAVVSELSSFYFLIVSFSYSVQCFLQRFLFKYILYTHTVHTRKKKEKNRYTRCENGYLFENQFQTNFVANFCVYVEFSFKAKNRF